MSSGGDLRFMSWNSNGLKNKIDRVRSEIKKCHIVFLQETHSNEVLDTLEDWKSIYTTGTSPNRGVAILIRKDVLDSFDAIEMDNKGCYVVVKCTLKGQLFTLVSLYNPPANTRPLIKLRKVIEKNADGILLIGGDFNTTLNPYLDRTSETKNKEHLSLNPVLEEFMTSFQLVDVWRRFHPTECEFTYKSSKNDVKAFKSRLDYLFVPEQSMHFIKTCEISEEDCCSDHQPVLFEIQMIKEEIKKEERARNSKKEERARNSKKEERARNSKKEERARNSEKQERARNSEKEERARNSKKEERARNSKKQERARNSKKEERARNSKKQERARNSKKQERARNSKKVTDKWLSYKPIYWTKRDLTKDPHRPPIEEKEIVNAVVSLAVNQKQVDRPDHLIPVLCDFYNNILQQSVNIPESFNEAFKVSETHYRFNVDYLILATIMARRLRDHLESHSMDYTDDRKKGKKAVLFTFKKKEIIKWSFLKEFLANEMDKVKTNPPIPDTNLTDIFYRILKSSSNGKYKFLRWGCPLTPVLKTLCLKCIANEMIEMVKDPTSKIFISRENVVVTFSLDFDKELNNLKEKYIFVECKLVDECKPVDANPTSDLR